VRESNPRKAFALEPQAGIIQATIGDFTANVKHQSGVLIPTYSPPLAFQLSRKLQQLFKRTRAEGNEPIKVFFILGRTGILLS
jgi:hypothetical protein